ncbi:MAG: hypothetical protein IH571_03405 [Acholeplasmataceae bacterium]|nr:hypothetical protein [Acholeplasmataceae bacterium]
MSQSYRTVLLDHVIRYPKMKIEDFVKLVYQSAFGPRHFSNEPNRDEIRRYLEDELKGEHQNMDSIHIESIGEPYARVHLSSIHQMKMTIDRMVDLLMKSMFENRMNVAEQSQLFHERMDVLLSMIDKQEIGLPYEDSKAFISLYLAKGVRPIHHSEIYRKVYNPQYRVIYLPLIKDMMI